MCGFAGFISSQRVGAGTIAKMTDVLSHRGPDASGYWADEAKGVYFGHRRLAIIDLSEAGVQPMTSPSGRYVIVYNGEIYNFASLKQSINLAWRGTSDTEVLLACIENIGIKETLQKIKGMFAFALWDRHEETLTLARDRIGEKPLYYGWSGESFLFASELKAMKTYDGFAGEISREALTAFFRYGYVPAPFSIYQGIGKLEAGTMLQIKLAELVRGNELRPERYWQASGSWLGAKSTFAGPEDAIGQLEDLLGEAIKGQMVADVPLGAFLSGGIDSSLIVAMMQASSSSKVHTFTIGFHEQAYNEADVAKEVARHLGTDHTELYVSPEAAMAVVPQLPDIYDEPFSDSSQIPTYLVASLAKRHVTVALSGDAGDELFGGYNRYIWADRLWRKLGKSPLVGRKMISAGIKAGSPAAWDYLFRVAGPLLPWKLHHRLPGDKLHKLAGALPAVSREDLYRRLVSQWNHPEMLVLDGNEDSGRAEGMSREVAAMLYPEAMMYQDLRTYLPDDILVKVDRAAMGVSLETRVPFLDYQIVEFAGRLPLEYKIRDGQGKWILRQILDKYVPRELIERPKMGFGVPIDSWLRGPLRDWAEDLLDAKRIREEGYLNSELVRQKWQEHLSGHRNWQHQLWAVLMFQAWLEKNKRVDGEI